MILLELLKFFLCWKKWHSCFLSFFKLKIIQFVFFERFEACKKLKSRFWGFFKFTKKKKSEIHLFWSLSILKKMRCIFQSCKKWNPYFMSFFKTEKFIFFEILKTYKKLMFLSCFSSHRIKLMFFWTFWSLQKLKFTFFELFNISKTYFYLFKKLELRGPFGGLGLPRVYYTYA